eukprot:TRINITY_DN13556_c0_g2_i1.p1 TRINITY_DN13556_c0_g2~~TRINITY_DN13556_c0_g2_i1.p1  ORF type:complete len:214 (-),score=48.61 TRINITY_DN13556_c0_g2_i1:3-644(-)
MTSKHQNAIAHQISSYIGSKILGDFKFKSLDNAPSATTTAKVGKFKGLAILVDIIAASDLYIPQKKQKKKSKDMANVFCEINFLILRKGTWNLVSSETSATVPVTPNDATTTKTTAEFAADLYEFEVIENDPNKLLQIEQLKIEILIKHAPSRTKLKRSKPLILGKIERIINLEELKSQQKIFEWKDLQKVESTDNSKSVSYTHLTLPTNREV